MTSQTPVLPALPRFLPHLFGLPWEYATPTSKASGNISAIAVTLKDAYGRPVPRTGSYAVTQGQKYTLSVAVTNKSVQYQTPVPAQFTVVFAGVPVSDGKTSQVLPLGANAQGSVGFNLAPVALGSEPFSVKLLDPNNVADAEVNDALNVSAPAVSYSGVIVVGSSGASGPSGTPAQPTQPQPAQPTQPYDPNANAPGI